MDNCPAFMYATDAKSTTNNEVVGGIVTVSALGKRDSREEIIDLSEDGEAIVIDLSEVDDDEPSAPPKKKKRSLDDWMWCKGVQVTGIRSFSKGFYKPCPEDQECMLNGWWWRRWRLTDGTVNPTNCPAMLARPSWLQKFREEIGELSPSANDLANWMGVHYYVVPTKIVGDGRIRICELVLLGGKNNGTPLEKLEFQVLPIRLDAPRSVEEFQYVTVNTASNDSAPLINTLY